MSKLVELFAYEEIPLEVLAKIDNELAERVKLVSNGIKACEKAIKVSYDEILMGCAFPIAAPFELCYFYEDYIGICNNDGLFKLLDGVKSYLNLEVVGSVKLTDFYEVFMALGKRESANANERTFATHLERFLQKQISRAG